MKNAFKTLQTPAYVLDEAKVIENLKVFEYIMRETGCKAILALKAFSTYSLFPLMRKYLKGTTSSSVHEATLAREEFGHDVHVYCPAYKTETFPDIVNLADYITFNSFSQWELLRPFVKNCEVGIRLNPEHSETAIKMYDPCQRYSRLGVTLKEFKPELMAGVTGFHIHTLCGQTAEALERTLEKVEEKFGPYLHQVKWVNLGGGHMVTKSDYNRKKLIQVLTQFQSKYNVQIIIEPGESVVLNAGYLVTSVLDIIKNEKNIVLLDTSAHAHMPDVIEMPYRPMVIDGGDPQEKPYTYRLGGITCLSGDIIGEYSFDTPLNVGDKLIFKDMAQYTMVKNTTFNGLQLPSICIYTQKGNLEVVKTFEYQDFKSRLS